MKDGRQIGLIDEISRQPNDKVVDWVLAGAFSQIYSKSQEKQQS